MTFNLSELFFTFKMLFDISRVWNFEIVRNAQSTLTGTWDLESSDNFDEYLKELVCVKVHIDNSKMALSSMNSMLFSNCYTHLLLSIVKWFSSCFQLWIASIDGNDYKVSWVFSVLVNEIVALSLIIFEFNHVYEKSTITFSNPTRLVHVQRKPDSGDLFTTVVRELIGEKLVTVDLHEFQADVFIRSLKTF